MDEDGVRGVLGVSGSQSGIPEKSKKPVILEITGFFGAGNVTRTHDLLITNQLLYRLSYISIFTFGVADLILTNQLLYASMGNDEII